MASKIIIKPFSIEEWKKGAKVETRDGQPVRILCTDAKIDTYDIVGLLEEDGENIVMTWDTNGRHFHRCEEDKRNLVIVEEVEEPEQRADEETNSPTGYGKYVDDCLIDASKHFFSEGEDKYSVADLFYAGVRCGKYWLEYQSLKSWDKCEGEIGRGWLIEEDSYIKRGVFTLNDACNHNVFITEKQAKSSLAMARISQLMAHDERYGGVVTDEEWNDSDVTKFAIVRRFDEIVCYDFEEEFHFLAFHTPEQRDCFLRENEQLVKDYLMIE